MEVLKTIVDEAIASLDTNLSAEQTEQVKAAMEAAVIRGLLEGQHRAVDVCKSVSEAEEDLAHKIATAIRKKNDALIVNLSSLR